LSISHATERPETGKPFGASLKLYASAYLSPLDIARSRPGPGDLQATAELAFLSACHKAELTGDSIAGEVLHLAAAAQYCGPKSVSGTVGWWEVTDTNGCDLTENFYRSMVISVGNDDERLGGQVRQGVQRYRFARSTKALR
jgi:hypothetical protein